MLHGHGNNIICQGKGYNLGVKLFSLCQCAKSYAKNKTFLSIIGLPSPSSSLMPEYSLILDVLSFSEFTRLIYVFCLASLIIYHCANEYIGQSLRLDGQISANILDDL